MLILSPEEMRKREFWEPCQSKEELYLHIKTFLGIDLPRHTIDELSTSNPLEFIWSIYHVMLTNSGHFRHVVATSRNQFKTLSSAIIHFYALIHFRRDCCQMAAIKSQSAACIKYIDKFLMIQELSGHANINNQSEKILTNLPPNSFTDKKEAKLLVIVATLKGTNSARASCFAGKTEVLVKKKTERKKGEGNYRRITMDGIYKRIRKGERWEAVSINPVSLKIECKPILAATRREEARRLIIKTKNGKEIECTSDHLLSAGYNGTVLYKRAGELVVGDSIFSKKIGSATSVEPDFFERSSAECLDAKFDEGAFSSTEIVEGTLLGDGCVFQRKKNGKYAGNALLTITKTNSARPWLDFVGSVLQSDGYNCRINDTVYSGYTGKQQLQFTTGMDRRLLAVRKRWYDEKGKKRLPSDFSLTWPMFAIWLMDDSTGLRIVSSESFSLEENQILCEHVNRLVGFECATVVNYSKPDGRNFNHISLHWPKEQIQKYKDLLPLIHPCYLYKNKKNSRKCKHCGNEFSFSRTENVCDNYECKIKEYVHTICFDEITSVAPISVDMSKRKRWVYDIQVQDNHNFFADGVLAHNCLINDEVELIDPDILSEAANIADPTTREGFDPVSIYLSSRKFAGGPLQSLIDEAENPTQQGDDSVKLHKWSLCDGMAKCPESLHRPNEPKIRALIQRDTLEILWDKEAEDIDVKGNFLEINAYAGCRTCGAFVVCQGRATRQPGRSPSLRTPKFVAGRVRDVKDTKKIIAQILNWKPESTGLVYPMFTPSLHIKNALEAYKWISDGNLFNPMKLTEEAYKKVLEEGDISEKKLIIPTKKDLYKLMVARGWKINWGVDWGYTDPASLVICGFDKKNVRALVLHAELKTGHSNQDWAAYVCQTYGKLFSPDLICPDMADGAAPTYFAKLGYVSRDTKPARIETGVSFVRSLLWNVSTQDARFCILDDKINYCLVEEMQNWTHLRTPTGYDFDKYDPETNTHTNDALRYLLDIFIEESDVVLQAKQKKQVSVSDLFEDAKDVNNLDAQIALAKKQMEDHFAKEHGLFNVFNETFRVPFAIPMGQPLPSCQLIQAHAEENEKKKGGFFYKF